MELLDPPAHPIAAVTHADPYPYYARLVQTAPLYFDATLGLTVASSADHVENMLRNPAARVRPADEPVPRAIAQTAAGEIFAQLVRMNDGREHARLRPAVEARLRALASGINARVSCETGDLDDFIERYPVYAVGNALGVDARELPELFGLVRAFARCIAPGAGAKDLKDGSLAARALLRRFADANEIGFLFQTYDATRGLIANTIAALASDPTMLRNARHGRPALQGAIERTIINDSPVQNTRRFIGNDAFLLVIAAANRDPAAAGRCFTFGCGPHACPGKMIALSIATDATTQIIESAINVGALRPYAYEPLTNVRIARFSSPMKEAP